MKEKNKMKKLTKSQEKDMKAMFTIFKNKYRGKDSFKLYTKNIREFFRITMDVYVFGDCEVPKNCGEWTKKGEWERSDAIKYWSELCKIKYRDINKYFYSVDDFSPYT